MNRQSVGREQAWLVLRERERERESTGSLGGLNSFFLQQGTRFGAAVSLLEEVHARLDEHSDQEAFPPNKEGESQG